MNDSETESYRAEQGKEPRNPSEQEAQPLALGATIRGPIGNEGAAPASEEEDTVEADRRAAEARQAES